MSATEIHENKESGPLLGLGSIAGLGAAVTKRDDDVALWANIVLLHMWGAVGYLKPGWMPAMAGVVQLVLLLAVYKARQLEAKLA